jgi:hypothetical protein
MSFGSAIYFIIPVYFFVIFVLNSEITFPRYMKSVASSIIV